MDWSKYIVKPLTLSLLTFSLSGCSKNPSPTEITGPGDSISQVSVDGETEQS